jgi:hypothetical protein
MHSILRSRHIASRINDPLTRDKLARYIRMQRRGMFEVIRDAERQDLPETRKWSASIVCGTRGYAILRLEFFTCGLDKL